MNIRAGLLIGISRENYDEFGYARMVPKRIAALRYRKEYGGDFF
jgi:hypothetical protein